MLTTRLSLNTRTTRQVINIYELRPEIEDDFLSDEGSLEIEELQELQEHKIQLYHPLHRLYDTLQYFGIFPFLDFLQLYAECTLEVRQLLDPISAKA